MRRVAWRFGVCLLTIATLISCELPRDNQPSILIIAVEGLGFDSVACDSEDVESSGSQGFQVLCQEAVRFSHAFSPSTMSQATMASLMTGLLPFEHNVRHNGGEFLSAKFKTLAEGALAKGYHTSFVSGGPPIWRKSGLAQGFEVFDDTMELSQGALYRPVSEVLKITRNWIEQESKNSPFFTVAFLADLQFPLVATTDEDGQLRERSRTGQLAEIDESIGQLVTWLKTRKKWNRTHVVLVGLNSMPIDSDAAPVLPLNLHSKSVQVSMFIKPARKEQDNIIQWAVDRNVSLLDLSHTVFVWLGIEPPVASVPELQPAALNMVLSKAEPNWKENRLLLTETSWPDWLEGAGSRFSVRQAQFLYIHDRKPLIYNTLTDRLETLPLKSNDPLWNSLNADVTRILRNERTPVFRGMQPHWLDQLEIAQELWVNNLAARRVQGGEAWLRWYLRRALVNRDWKEVKRLAGEVAEPIGGYIASRHLGESMPMPKHPCVRLIMATKNNNKSYQSECEDERVLALFNWREARNDEDRRVALERFTHLYGQYLFDQEIGRMNYLNGLRWDVDRELPQPPQIVDYLLTLKEFESFNKAKN